MARPRLRSALLAGALLAMGIPAYALATAPALHCGVEQHGYWEELPVKPFEAVNGLASPTAVSTFTVDEGTPQDLAATNGVRIETTIDHGCSWQDAYALSEGPTQDQTFAGLGAHVVSLALLGSKKVAAVAAGTGVATAPHVLVQSGDGSWTTADSGLPAVGTPKLLRAANDGETLYLTISPTGAGGGDTGTTGGVLGGLPIGGTGGIGGSAATTGLLYRSGDAGHSWTLATTATDLPTGGTGFTALDIDPGNAMRVYGLVGGALAISTNGGASFSTTNQTDFTALTAMGPGAVVAFESSGKAFLSNDGSSFKTYPAPAGVTSVGYRDGDPDLMLDVNGLVERYGITDDKVTPVQPGLRPTAGSMTGDRSGQSSFHALSGNTVLRYVDPVAAGSTVPTIAVGDTSVPPPRAGVVVPAVRTVTLPVGQSSTADFTLDLPKNPTPLDLYFLVDVSDSMTDYINNLKTNIFSIVNALKANKVDLKVGLGTIGTGPGKGEQPWPQYYVYPPDTSDPLHPKPGPTYHKPLLYKRIRAVGATDATLRQVVTQLVPETDPTGVGPADAREGDLLSLVSLSNGMGWHTQAEDAIHSPNYSEVPPGQEAGFRGSKAVRRYVIMATDEAFDVPYPQQQLPGGTLDNPKPDFSMALNALNANDIHVIGLSAGKPDSLDDLRHLARSTHTFAPPGGVLCDDGRVSGIVERIPQGAPLVCDSGDHFSDAIIRILNSLVDRQSVSLVAEQSSPVLGSLQDQALTGLNVKKPNAANFSVDVSCVDVKPGSYKASVDAVLRSTKVGTARVVVNCVKAAAVAPPAPIKPLPLTNNPGQAPPAQVVNPATAPLAPPAPAVQPQVQPQTQPQVQGQTQANPMTAGAIHNEQELQLALAINGTSAGTDDNPGFSAGRQMGMVDRRKREQAGALGVLAFAMVTCSGFGLARLRARPEAEIRRAR